ncbi:MAG: hypothetical protein V4508_10945 [Pseudomonadota bacterium]
MNSKDSNPSPASALDSIKNTEPLFPLGSVNATPGALDLLDRHGFNAASLLDRHQFGDFGTICAEDAAENMVAIKFGSRILSAFDVGRERLWIITEADRSVR